MGSCALNEPVNRWRFTVCITLSLRACRMARALLSRTHNTQTGQERTVLHADR